MNSVNFVIMNNIRVHEPEVYIPRDPHIPIYNPTFMDILALYTSKKSKYNKISIFIGEREFYKDLKEKYPQLSKYGDSQIAAHIKGFNIFVTETIIWHKDGVLLPANLGFVMVCTMGRRNFAIDHKASAEKKVKVYHKNDHSEGYGGGLYYSTTQIPEGKTIPERMYSNCEYWMLESSKRLDRLIEAEYKKDWKKFHMLPKSRRYTDMIPSYKKTLKNKKVIKELKDSYNEFDFSK